MSTVVGVSRFGRMMERIFAESDAPYTPSEKLVLIAIGRHFGDKDSCWPTLARIAAQTGLSHRTVERLLKYHCEKSPRPLLARRRRESDETRGKWTNYVYTLIESSGAFVEARNAYQAAHPRHQKTKAAKVKTPAMTTVEPPTVPAAERSLKDIIATAEAFVKPKTLPVAIEQAQRELPRVATAARASKPANRPTGKSCDCGTYIEIWADGRRTNFNDCGPVEQRPTHSCKWTALEAANHTTPCRINTTGFEAVAEIAQKSQRNPAGIQQESTRNPHGIHADTTIRHHDVSPYDTMSGVHTSPCRINTLKELIQ